MIFCRLATALAGFSALASLSGAIAGEVVPDPGPVLQSCAVSLADKLATRKFVTLPIVFSADCPGGGFGETSANVDAHPPKFLFVQAASLGDPANWVIEGAAMEKIEDSGGPSFTGPTFNADTVFASASCSHGAFGGGVTAKFRLVAKLRDVMSDDRARSIGRLCVALVFHPGSPR